MTQNELPKWRVEATLDAHFNAENIWELKKLARKTENEDVKASALERLKGVRQWKD